MISIKLEKNKKRSLMTKVVEVHPNHLYFKIPSGYKILVNLNDEVKKNTILAVSENNTSIVSSVSGKIIKCDEVIVIQNNHSEQKEIVDVSNINKEKFIQLLKDSGIIGMGGAGYPTYKKYSVDKIDTLIINAIECEPFITADYTIAKLHALEIVDAIKQIMKINNIRKTIIVLKKDNNGINEFFKPYLIDNIEIKELKGNYPLGWERKLIKETLNIEYDKIPIEKNIIVNNLSTIYAIKRLLDGKRLDARMVTITGDIDSGNYLVKIGTSIHHLIKDINVEGKNVIIGGPMMGKLYDNDVVTPTTNCILILNKNNEKTLPCIRCGKCINICPVYLEPVLIKDNINNKKELEKLRVKKCMECGLCSYICPSKIDLRSKIIEAKRR